VLPPASIASVVAGGLWDIVGAAGTFSGALSRSLLFSDYLPKAGFFGNRVRAARKPEALTAGAHSSESAFCILPSSAPVVPVAEVQHALLDVR
jgi:hypothetical protein